jgi:uncharacterized protein YigA (DUF484 family)
MTISGSIGLSRGDDLLQALQGAAEAAWRSGGDTLPRAALVLVAGAGNAELLAAAARKALPRVPLAGGLVAGILSDGGVTTSGAAVCCFYGDLNPSVALGGRAPGLSAATERAGRLMLAGAPDRRHYPRGMALAFARPVATSFTEEFLVRWRHLAGPKLRTVFSATSGDPLSGPGSESPGELAVLSIEGAYQSGIGVAPGFVPGETVPDAATLVHGSADAATTAVKRLEGQTVRIALVAESAVRHAALGPAAREEWMAMRDQIGLDVPCLGWLTRAECGYGRGVTASGETGSVVVAALGDPAPAPDRP